MIDEEKSLLMVTITGPDKPGIMAALSRVLSRHEVELENIEQASLQRMLAIYLLLDLSNVKQSKDSVIKDLLFEATKLNLTLNFRLVSPDEVAAALQRRLFVLTLFGGVEALAELTGTLAEENVNIEAITSRTHHRARSVEMVINVNKVSNLSRLKQKVMLRSRELNIDLALQKMEAYRKSKRLIFFDVDSTLIDAEIIDEMARKAGVFQEVSRITEKAMRGDFDFEESLIQRVALLKGLTVEKLIEIRDGLRLSEGIKELLVTLQWLGYKTGIVTGGFDFFADHFKETLKFDFAFANHLEIKDGALTGKVTGNIIDAAEKARIVSQTACSLGIPLDQIIVVGDGANDTLMLGQAGLGIAYNAKPVLDRVANVSLGRDRFKSVFHLLGITDENIDEAMSCTPLDAGDRGLLNR